MTAPEGRLTDPTATLVLTHRADTIKMLRETFCAAQWAVNQLGRSEHTVHAGRLQRLIDECDRQRPLGSDGKHGDQLHTPTCGCDR